MAEQRLRLAVIGANGRMGQRIRALASDAEDLAIAAAIDRDGPPLDELSPDAVDGAIDFSTPSQTPATCAWCAEHRVPLVFGTTGLGAAKREALDRAAAAAPVVAAANFSVGMNVLFALAREVTELAGEGWDAEIVEAHHRHKVDAPSGTARRLAAIVAEARGQEPEEVVRCGREGATGPRPDEEIGVSVLRGGDVAGEHTLWQLGRGEQLFVGHRATDRDVFAQGVLRALRWACRTERGPGRYDMADVLRG